MTIGHDVADRDVLAIEILFGHVEQAGGNLEASRERSRAAFNKAWTISSSWGIGNSLLEWQALPWRPVISITPSVCLMKRPQCFAMPGLGSSISLSISARTALRRGKADEAIALIRESSAAVARFTTNSHSSSRSLRWPPPQPRRRRHGPHELLGTWDAVTERIGASAVDKTVRELRERTEREVRERLGPARWSGAYAAGHAASIDSLLKDIDSARAPEVM